MKNMKPLFLMFALAVCGQVLAQQQPIVLKNIKEINGKQLDFSPMPFGNGIMFTSSKSNRFLQCPPQGKGDYTDIKYAEKKADGTFDKPVKIGGDINTKYNDGSMAFFPGGNKMIFSANNLEGKNDQNVIDLKLYTAELTGGKWDNITELPFNSNDFSTCHPALSKDGNLLVFASNRPGSNNGSMDLYYSKNENGVWSIPASVGAINTEANEIFPFLDEYNNLFFSSDRSGGQGGLDIYGATFNSATNTWDLVGNMGEPFSKGGDDVNFVVLNNGTEGYLASDRGGNDAQGMDDIYHWKYTPNESDHMLAVEDKETAARLSDASIEMSPIGFANMLDRIYAGSLASKAAVLKTGRDGTVTVRVRDGVTYAMLTTKADYKQDKAERSTATLKSTNPYVIKLEKDKYFAKLIVEVVEDPSGIKLQGADIKIFDKTTGQYTNLVSDANGIGTMQIDCDHQYEIIVSKQDYLTNTVQLSNYKLDCKDGEVKVIVPLKKNPPIVLEPIFFDFDKSYIRDRDAKPALNGLVDIMNKYPTLVVRLSGNTDARGTHKYNVGLSTRRSTSAKSYLVSKGISKERILTEQFGEEKPINNCVDDVKCAESDHQLNRRVDVSAERHGEPGVNFRTRPVSEMTVISDRK